MTAHPKRDRRPGELLFFGYGFMPPYLNYHPLSAAGELVEPSRRGRWPTMMHDFAITENYVMWLDLPVVLGMTLVRRHAVPLGSGLPGRVGVMPRAGGAVRWFDIDSCYVFYVGNAFETVEGRIVLDAVRHVPEDLTAICSGMCGAEGSGGSGRAASMGARPRHRSGR